VKKRFSIGHFLRLLLTVLPAVWATSLSSQTTNAPAPVATTNAPAAAAEAVPDRVESVQLDLGNGFFVREFYDLALVEYQKYLDWFPNGTAVEEVMYRMAECQRGLGKLDDARARYLAVQKAFQKGQFFARASFRLGEMESDANHPEQALPYYRETIDRAEGAATKLAGYFYLSRTLMQLQRTAEALPPLQELARVEKDNPYRAFALLELARVAETANQTDEARLLYTRAFETDASPILRAEGGMKAAAILMKAQQWADAANFFEKVVKLDPDGDWVPFANLNLLRCYYQGNRFVEVLRLTSEARTRLSKDAAAEKELLQAHALRSLRKYAEAVSAYDLFLKDFPQHASAENASYERLICLFATESKNWETEANAFMKARPNSAGIPYLLYLMGDRAFRRKDYTASATLYASVPLDKLSAAQAAEVLYREGLSLSQTGKHREAAKTFGDFIQRFPNHEWTANALYQRGMSEEQAGIYQLAAESFRQVVERFPKAPEREGALYRVALLQGEMQQYAAMRTTFAQLGREYAHSKYLTEAGYWTGWSFFEEKKYKEALPELLKARQANAGQYGSVCTSRIILSYYFLGQRLELLKEVNALPADSAPLAPEIYEWLARQSAQNNDPASAEKCYRRLIAHPNAAAWVQSARWGLAKSVAAQSKWKEAVDVWEDYEKDYPAPATSMPARLELIHAYTMAKNYTRAQEVAEEVMKLQPEGGNNAQARLLLGEALADQKKFGEAGKYFLSVAVLYSDPEITPRALTRAIQSFESAGETNQVSRLKQELKKKYPDYK
jgi:TolA-binding protein